jgi:autotransporter adhesin
MVAKIESVSAKSVLALKLMRYGGLVAVAGVSLAVGVSAGLAQTALSSTSLDSNGDSVVFDTGSATVGATGTAVGDSSTASGDNSSALGASSTASGNNSSALGANSTASGNNSSALGANSTARGTNSVAVGAGASALGNNSTAIGANAFVAVSGNNSVALGQGSIATRPNTVSVGAPGQERQITNVAAGVAPTDAANVGQLNALQNQITGNLSEARRGIAATSALAYVPTPSGPGRTTFALNGSYFQGERGLGVALAHRFGTEIPLYFSAAYGNGGGTQHIGRVGMGVEW